MIYWICKFHWSNTRVNEESNNPERPVEGWGCLRYGIMTKLAANCENWKDIWTSQQSLCLTTFMSCLCGCYLPEPTVGASKHWGVNKITRISKYQHTTKFGTRAHCGLLLIKLLGWKCVPLRPWFWDYPGAPSQLVVPTQPPMGGSVIRCPNHLNWHSLSMWTLHVLPMFVWVFSGCSGFPHHQKHMGKNI